MKFNLPDIIEKDCRDKEDYQHRLKYLNLYIRIIDRCLSMTKEELSCVTEKHHILPKCMGGSNKKDNIVVLPVRYHIMAHIVLSEAYPDNFKLGYATLFTTSYIERVKDRSTILQKSFSTRFLAQARETAIKSIKKEGERIRKSGERKGKNNPMFGKHLSEETKKKMSEAKKGTKLTEEQRKKWSEVKLGEKNSFWGKSHTDKVKDTIAKKVADLWKSGKYDKVRKDLKKTRGNSKFARKVVSPEGVVYDCLLDAIEASGIPSSTLRGWMKGLTKDNHGWKYLNPKTKNELK